MTRLCIQLVERYLRRTHFSYNCLFNSNCHSVFFIGSSHIVSTNLHGILRVSHSYAESGQLDHCHITYSVADSNHFFPLHVQFFQQSSQRVGLIYGTRNDFQKIWLGTENIQCSVQSSFPMIFQTDQRFFIIADQHTLTGCKINSGRKFRFLDYPQIIQPGFILNMFIFRRVRNNRIIMISE